MNIALSISFVSLLLVLGSCESVDANSDSNVNVSSQVESRLPASENPESQSEGSVSPKGFYYVFSKLEKIACGKTEHEKLEVCLWHTIPENRWLDYPYHQVDHNRYKISIARAGQRMDYFNVISSEKAYYGQKMIAEGVVESVDGGLESIVLIMEINTTAATAQIGTAQKSINPGGMTLIDSTFAWQFIGEKHNAYLDY